VCLEDDDGAALARRWNEVGIEIPLETVDAPYRDIGAAAETHIRELRERWPGAWLTVVTSQYSSGGLFDDVLHNQSLALLGDRLTTKEGVVVASVPYRITTDRSPPPADAAAPVQPAPTPQEPPPPSAGGGER
jgi:hypothetical protein